MKQLISYPIFSREDEMRDWSMLVGDLASPIQTADNYDKS
jgi:hypothetical protein